MKRKKLGKVLLSALLLANYLSPLSLFASKVNAADFNPSTCEQSSHNVLVQFEEGTNVEKKVYYPGGSFDADETGLVRIPLYTYSATGTWEPIIDEANTFDNIGLYVQREKGKINLIQTPSKDKDHVDDIYATIYLNNGNTITSVSSHDTYPLDGEDSVSLNEDGEIDWETHTEPGYDGAVISYDFNNCKFETPKIPELLGNNKKSESTTYGETPVDETCHNTSNPLIGEKEERYASVWTSVNGLNIKYVRHNVRPDGSHLLLGQTSRYITDNPNNLSEIAKLTDSYQYSHSNGWGTFGGGEGLYTTQVRAFSDINENDKYDEGEPISSWSNVCASLYDFNYPEVINSTMYVNGNESYITKSGDEVKIVAEVSDDASSVERVQIWVREYPWNPNNNELTWGEMTKVNENEFEFTFIVPDTYKDGDTLNEVFEGNYFNFRPYDSAGNSHIGWRDNFTIDSTAPEVSIDSIELFDKNGTAHYTTEWKVNDNTPTIVGTVDDNKEVESVEVTVNGSTYTASVSGNEWAVTTDELPDGTHTIKAVAKDTAGNEKETTQEITIDTVAPNATYTQYRNRVEITEDIAYVKDVTELSFKGEITDADPSSGLLYDSFVIFQAQDDGSFRFSANGKKAYCGWRKKTNMVEYNGTKSFSITDRVDYSLCTDTLEDGEYYMAHHVYDEAVREDIPTIHQFRDVLGLHFVVDGTAPEIEWVQLEDGSIHNNVFTMKSSSNETLNNARFKWKKEGSDDWVLGDNLNFEGTEYEYEFNPGEDGVYVLRAQGRDLALNWSRAEDITVTYDSTRPTGKILTPTDGEIVRETITVSGWVKDETSEIDRVEVRLRNHPDNTFRTEWVEASLDEDGNYTVDLDTTEVDDGLYEVAVVAYDNAGNNKWLWPRPVIAIDSTAPVVEITKPNELDLLNGKVTIRGLVQDENLSHYNIAIYTAGVDVHDFSLRLEQETMYTNEFDEKDIYTWDSTQYADGEYQIRLAARDLAGNRELNGDSEHVITVTIDNTAPEITITSPEDKSLANGVVTVDTTVTDEHEKTTDVYALDEDNERHDLLTGETGDDLSVDFDTTTVNDGIYTIYVESTDQVGNKSTESVQIVVDNTAPEDVMILMEVNEELSTTANEGEVSYFYTVKDEDVKSWQWYVDGEMVPTGTTRDFSHTWENNSMHTVTVEVTDEAGNTETYSYEIEVNNVAPTLEEMEDIEITLGDLVSFEAVATDPSFGEDADELTYTWDMGDGSDLINGMEVKDYEYSEVGDYTVTLTVNDNDHEGNGISTTSFTVTVLEPTVAGAATEAPLGAPMESGEVQGSSTEESSDLADTGSTVTWAVAALGLMTITASAVALLKKNR